MSRRRLLAILAAVAVIVTALGLWWRREDQLQREARAKTLPPRELGREVSKELLHDLARARGRFIDGGAGQEEALRGLAALYLSNGFDSQGEAVLRLLVEREPTEARWPHLLGRVLSGYGRLEESLPFFRTALQRESRYVPSRLQYAEALAKLNRLAEAKAEYLKVLELASNTPHARLGLAKLAVQEEDWREAERQLRTALEVDPKFSGAEALLATVAEKQGDATGAEAHRQRASSLGKFREAADPWWEALQEACLDPYRLRVVASTFAASGDHPRAIAYWEKAYTLDPENAKLCRELGAEHLSQRNAEKAEPLLAKAVRLAPRDPAAYLDLLGIHKLRHDTAAARKLLENGLSQCPNSAGLHFEYAMLLHSLGEREGVLEHLSEAVRLEPESLAAYVELAAALFRERRMPEGREVLEAALARQPSDVAVLSMLARFHVMAGEREKAREFFLRAVKAGADESWKREIEALFRRRFGEAP